MIRPLSAAAAFFWLLTETVIVMSLVWLDGRLLGRTRRLAWTGYGGLFALGVGIILAGPRLFRGLGPAPFPNRLAWDLLCAAWLVLEWSMLVHLTEVTRTAARRFLGRTLAAIPCGWHLGGIGAVLAATAFFHWRLLVVTSTPAQIGQAGYLFVRLAGFGYLALEAALAVALWRAYRLVRELVAQ